MDKHFWSYEENEHCVEEVFKNFVINKESDTEVIVTRLYLHFDGKIKKSSITMKLQNIKYLLDLYNIPSTLTLKPLNHASQDNMYAFFSIVRKYNGSI